jgi:hypothetical protein
LPARSTAALSLSMANPYSGRRNGDVHPRGADGSWMGGQNFDREPFAMAGDLFSSVAKHRLHLASSSIAIGLDHIPEFLLPLLASRLLLPLSIFDIG